MRCGDGCLLNHFIRYYFFKFSFIRPWLGLPVLPGKNVKTGNYIANVKCKNNVKIKWSKIIY